MKAYKKTNQLRNNSGKECQEGYPTSAVYTAAFEADVGVVFVLFLSSIVL